MSVLTGDVLNKNTPRLFLIRNALCIGAHREVRARRAFKIRRLDMRDWRPRFNRYMIIPSLAFLSIARGSRRILNHLPAFPCMTLHDHKRPPSRDVASYTMGILRDSTMRTLSLDSSARVGHATETRNMCSSVVPPVEIYEANSHMYPS